LKSKNKIKIIERAYRALIEEGFSSRSPDQLKERLKPKYRIRIWVMLTKEEKTSLKNSFPQNYKI